jgi:hypothetical protein
MNQIIAKTKVSHEKVKVIYPSVNIEYKKPKEVRAKISEELNIDSITKLILFTAKNFKSSGVKEVLDICSSINYQDYKLLIPRFATTNNFNVFLYNYYTDTMEKIISKSDMVVPGKYQAGEITTVEKIYTIELRDGTLLLMFSGNKAGIDYKDIWRYI